jgi:hypothetical protein
MKLQKSLLSLQEPFIITVSIAWGLFSVITFRLGHEQMKRENIKKIMNIINRKIPYS